MLFLCWLFLCCADNVRVCLRLGERICGLCLMKRCSSLSSLYNKCVHLGEPLEECGRPVNLYWSALCVRNVYWSNDPTQKYKIAEFRAISKSHSESSAIADGRNDIVSPNLMASFACCTPIYIIYFRTKCSGVEMGIASYTTERHIEYRKQTQQDEVEINSYFQRS